MAALSQLVARLASIRRSTRRRSRPRRRASVWRAIAAASRPAKRRSKELQKDLDKIAAERQRINARLVETAKLIQQSEAQLNLIEARLGELAAQERHLRGPLEQSHGKISSVLAPPWCAWVAIHRR